MSQSITANDLIPIPGFKNYFLSRDKEVYRYLGNLPYPFYRKLVLRDGRHYVMHPNGQERETKIVTVNAILKLISNGSGGAQNEASTSGVRTTTMNLNGCKEPLTRTKAINMILRYMPDVQVPLTKNAHDKYETSNGMRDAGMVVCEDCGHIQAVEIKLCVNCRDYIINQVK